MPNSSSPSTKAATACLRRRFQNDREHAGRARESRASTAHGRDGRAGRDAARATLRADARSHCAISSAARSCSRRRSAMVRRPRSASEASSGLEPIAKSVEGRAQALRPFLVGGDEAEQQIGMAGEIFGAGLDREIAAALMRREEERRRPGVVEDDADAPRMRGRGDGGNVLHLHALRAGRLHQHRGRLRPDQRRDSRRR